MLTILLWLLAKIYMAILILGLVNLFPYFMGLYEAYVINALWIDLFSFLHYDVLDSERLSRVKLFLYYVG